MLIRVVKVGQQIQERCSSNSDSSAAPQPQDANARRPTLMEELVWMIGGARPGTGAVTAGSPFVFVGAPGDYVFGGEGLDAVVTQLLGQLENAGPPPLPRERLAALPDEPVTEDQAAANIACSVCWDNFSLGETICKLECEHIFHSACIRPWLQLHATCPICRRSLMPPAPPVECAAAAAAAAVASAAAAAAAAAATTTTTTNTTTNTTNTTTATTTNTTDTPPANNRPSLAAALPRILLRRIVHHPALRPSGRAQGWATASSSARPPQGNWPPPSHTSDSSTNTTNSTSNTSTTPSATSIMSDIERHYNMDLDMD